MEFVELIISPSKRYSYKAASNTEMNILGDFLAHDIGYRPTPFKKWAFDNTSNNANGNLTALEKNGDYIFLTDVFTEDKNQTTLKMTHEAYVQILTDWEDKVCNVQPKTITIKHENNQFAIETTIDSHDNKIIPRQQTTSHPNHIVAPHSYPLWIKIGFIMCCIFFSLYIPKMPYYFALTQHIKTARRAFFNKNYAAARIAFTELSQKMPYNKEIRLYLAQSLFTSDNKEDHMTALKLLTKEQLNEREWKELLKYMPLEYANFFTYIEKGKK